MRGQAAGVQPETRYAKTTDGLYIAYQVIGDGPNDLVFTSDWTSHVRAGWDMPWIARFYHRLASFGRLILFDKRGTGMSDPVPPSEIGSIEKRIDDLRTVLDATSAERAAIIAVGVGGPMAIVFAATYPKRTSALVLFDASACPLRRDDYPIGMPPELFERFASGSPWGEHSMALPSFLSPSVSHDEAFNRAWQEHRLQTASPGVAIALIATAWRDDARQALSAVQAPTLVVHRRGDRVIRLAQGRYLAQHIPGARLVELDGEDHLWFAGETDTFIDEIQEFLTGVRPIAESSRVLATVMFTDFVDSTAKAVALGDSRWKSVLDEHDALVRRQLERFRGRYINTTGDGVLAMFDGPARGVRCAQAICDGVRALGLEVRAGLHTGEVELRGDDIGGIAVHIAARVSALAAPGEVLVSRTVKDLVAGSGLVFSDRGTHELKGVPDAWQLYGVAGQVR